MKNNFPRYIVVGPDEIPIRPTPFESKAAAEKAVTEFAKRFAPQGYYRDANGERIEVADIPSRCRIEPA